MPVTIVTLPPQECALAAIYRLLASHGATLDMRRKYKNILRRHVKWCRACQNYSEYVGKEAERIGV